MIMICGISIPWYERFVGFTTAVDSIPTNVWIVTEKFVT